MRFLVNIARMWSQLHHGDAYYTAFYITFKYFLICGVF